MYKLLKYVLSGGTAVFIHISILYWLVEALHLPKTLATTIGFFCGCCINYTLQYHFVFRATCCHYGSILRYATVTVAMLGINALLFWSLIHFLSLWYMAAQILTTGIIFLANFLINRSFTFNSSPGKKWISHHS